MPAPFMVDLLPLRSANDEIHHRAWSNDVEQRLANLPSHATVVKRTRDAYDEGDDPLLDSRAGTAVRWGAVSNLIVALWDPNAAHEVSPLGRTLLHTAANVPIEKVMPVIVDKLVRAGVPLDAQDLLLDNTALHLAVERLVNTPLSVVCDDRYQRQAMLERVERLLDHGANPNVPNLFGNTALHQVFCQRSPGVNQPIPWSLIERLLRAGADMSISNRGGVLVQEVLQTALQQEEHNEDGVQKQSQAQRRGWSTRSSSLVVRSPSIHVDTAAQARARESVALRLALPDVPGQTVQTKGSMGVSKPRL